eukprot:TRINITY_DN37461_c0_g1_i3.p1 TRINITY_DN37461_c0_g1~~TRINITY_DN37461_c0_g1_i3.p1  ORF type:complete len:239 (+),score=52.05 TRINITY_DN37461_c0_g1_i3:61-777(+)
MAGAAAAAIGGARRGAARASIETRSLGALSSLRHERNRLQASARQEERERLAKLEPRRFVTSLFGGEFEGRRQLQLEMLGHQEEHRCTYYEIRCTLRGTGERQGIEWQCKKRLCEIREEIRRVKTTSGKKWKSRCEKQELYDLVYSGMGPADYQSAFAETPFARRGGLPGTTARLTLWLETLATHINLGFLQAELAILLLALSAPLPEQVQQQLGALPPVVAAPPSLQQAHGYPIAAG